MRGTAGSNVFPTLKYLNINDLNLFIEALKNWKKTLGRLDRNDLSQQHLLKILSDWQMPIQVLLAALAYQRLEQQEPISQEKERFAGEAILAMAQCSYNLNRLINSKADLENNKPLTTNLIRQLFTIAYDDLDTALMCLAVHISKLNIIKANSNTEAKSLAASTLYVFLPFMEMLGLKHLQRELGNWSLKTLFPREWNKILHYQKEVYTSQRACFETLKQELLEREPLAEVSLNSGSVLELFQAIQQKKPLKEIVQEMKVDVFVPTQIQCFDLLKSIKDYKSRLEKQSIRFRHFQDWINRPKFNGYRALFIEFAYSVQRQGNKLGQLYVRTREMEKINEFGVIEVRYISQSEAQMNDVWWENKTSGFKSPENIYVFSPKGELRMLPKGSTPIDYAYHVHSDLGNHCKLIWVNGYPASYDLTLQNYDLIEIEADPKHFGPQKEWEHSAITSLAKENIKRLLKKQEKFIQSGQQILKAAFAKEIRRYGLRDISPEAIERFLKGSASRFHYPSVSSLYQDISSIGHLNYSESLSPENIAFRFVTNYLSEHILRIDGSPLNIPKEKIRFARCYHKKKTCLIIPGTPIIGRIVKPKTFREHIIVYRMDCPNAPMDGTGVELAWLGDMQPKEAANITIAAVDRPKLLYDLLNSIYRYYDDGLYLLAARAEVARDRSAQVNVTVEAPNYRLIGLLSQALNELKNEGKIYDLHINALSPIEKIRLMERKVLPNPYTLGPIMDRRVFKGRDEEIHKIVSYFEGSQNVVVLYGINRIGKTSLMKFLQHYLGSEHNFASVLIDLAGLAMRSESHLWYEIINRVEEGCRLPRLLTTMSSFGDFQKWLDTIVTRLEGKKLLIMLDELNAVDELWDKEVALNAISRLKYVVEKYQNVSFIFSGQGAFEKSQPLIDAAAILKLDYIDSKAAERLIREPMEQMLQFDEEVVKSIIHITACHPYFLQNIMLNIVNYASVHGYKTVGMNHLEQIVLELLDTGTHLFYDFLRENWRFKRVVLEVLAYLSKNNQRASTIEEMEDELSRRGLNAERVGVKRTFEFLEDIGIITQHIEANIKRYSIRVPLFEQWLYNRQVGRKEPMLGGAYDRN